VAAGTAASVAALAIPPVRRVVAERVLPAPGEGPPKEAREAGYFALHFVGKGDEAGNKRPEVRVVVRGKGDPGYGGTARMLAEAGVCLALDRDAIDPRGGVLTPASCMGMRLIERLAHVGFTFEAEDAS
jgi:short subunit dehydrogenase-like uncharacterized protein